LLVGLFVLALCAPLGLAVSQDGRRLVEDGVFGADLSGVVPANLDRDLDRARTEAARMPGNPELLAAVVCVPDDFKPPAVTTPPERELLLAVKPRAADLKDLKLLFREYGRLQKLDRDAMERWENTAFAPDHPYFATLKEFHDLARAERRIRDLVKSGKSGVESALTEYRKRPYHNQDFYRVQLGLLHEQQFRSVRGPAEFKKYLGTALEGDATGLTAARKELEAERKTLDSYLSDLGDTDKREEEAARLRRTWQERLGQWQKGLELLDLRARADRVGTRGDSSAVKEMLTRLEKLAGDEKFKALMAQVRAVAKKFLDGYLPGKLPLDPDVQVARNNDSGYETVRRATIKIAWNDSTFKEMKTAKEQDEHNEFNIDSWKGQATVLIVGGSTRAVDLRPTERGALRNRYNTRRGAAVWSRDYVRALAKEFGGAESALGADCVRRLKILAEVMPDCFH
jgi:hypothetical protein